MIQSKRPSITRQLRELLRRPAELQLALNAWTDAARKAAALARRAKFWSKAGARELLVKKAGIPVHALEGEHPFFVLPTGKGRTIWGAYNPPLNLRLAPDKPTRDFWRVMKKGVEKGMISVGEGKHANAALLHEIGHVKSKHGMKIATLPEDQRLPMEQEAWRWAVKHYKRLGVSKKKLFQVIRTSEVAGGYKRGTLYPVTNEELNSLARKG